VSEFQDVDAQPVAWREGGSGPLVLFLGGLGQTRTAFDHQIRALASGYRCVVWDMPSYGASAPVDELTYPLLADSAATLIGTLGETRAHIVGLSMGGQIAMHLTLRHPALVRSLALLDTSPAFGLNGTDPEEWKAQRLGAFDAGETTVSIAEPVHRMLMGPDVSDAAVAEAVASMARITTPAFRIAVKCLTTHDVSARLGEIAVPTIVLNGELDEETPVSYAEAIAAGIPGARLQVIAGAGHITNLEAPDVVNAALRAHLDAVEAPK
jgi:3-oxoadipate enol-lactonase